MFCLYTLNYYWLTKHLIQYILDDSVKQELRCLCFQSLSLRDRHGPDFHYVVMQHNEVTRTWFRHNFVVPGNQSSTVIVVDNAVARVSLLSCNVVGCSNASTIVRLPDSISRESLFVRFSTLLNLLCLVFFSNIIRQIIFLMSFAMMNTEMQNRRW